ncbi:TetR/AcrR family transcriptional regulator [Streptomyces hoynatensis]|uniref:TetR/AcrR family transcriptional regulator n=1 Tax=Streptomyces hoynatensis TaxID=1141874 RepID=A0A3A9ZBP3_9ACTN|nr:TetR/AcrR family transcriptional regulator [Streptomyces hoynatensis]RKN45700.1 TetR/AcrR family transcriptional regulator [Streptomyces hoynatensis]
MTAIQGARERARREITAAIKDEARRRLAEEGASRLSLRAVARELGMVSSALYRYFPSRDELLTALIVDAYDALGEAAERAAARAPRTEPAVRWREVCRAVRSWALAHPHEFGLIHGTPVPGYAAPPQLTGVPGTRVPRALLAVALDAHHDGLLGASGFGPLPEPVRAEAEALAAQNAPGLPAPAMAAVTAAWAELVGLVAFEVFGQYNGVVQAREEFFTHAVTRLAAEAGLGAAP